MKEFLLIFHLIIIMSFHSNGQLSNDSIKIPNQNQTKTSTKIFFLVTESFQLKNDGNNFLTEHFLESTIIDFEDEKFKVDLRYRLADDEMQIMHQNTIKALYPQKVKKVIFKRGNGDQIFIPFEYVDQKSVQFGYFQLLTDGKMKLLKQYQKGGKGKIKTLFLAQSNDRPAEYFKVKKSTILKLLKKHKSEVSKFIVKNKLNVKEEEDLKKVFDFYNSLL